MGLQFHIGGANRGAPISSLQPRHFLHVRNIVLKGVRFIMPPTNTEVDRCLDFSLAIKFPSSVAALAHSRVSRKLRSRFCRGYFPICNIAPVKISR